MRARDLPSTIVLVALGTAVARAVRDLVALPDLVMIYVAVIMVAAAFFGRGASLLASALSVAAYDFVCVPPYYTLAIAESRHLVTFVMMFVVGLLVSELVARVRRAAEAAEGATLRARTEEMRSSLLSAVSHDLRTPLAVITGAATTLRDQGDRLDVAERAELLDTVCEEAERLERLVRNLLDMTRVEAKGMKVQREWIPVEEIIGSALTRLERWLEGRSIVTRLPADLPMVSVDPVLLEQVFVNLFENAAKHTPPGSALDVTARSVGGAVEIIVADRGPGFAEGEELRIFEKFHRGRGVTAPGAGLGLAIVRGVVEAHGGTVTASNREGGGAEMHVLLPIVGTPPGMPAAEDAHAASVP